MFKDVEVIDIGEAIVVKYSDSLSYTIRPFEGKQGTKLLAKLTKYTSSMFGGVLQGIANNVEGDTEDDKVDTVSILLASSLEGAFSTIDDEAFLEFFYELFTKVSRDNSLIDYDKEFKKNYTQAFDLAKHIIKYNFSSVFQQLGIAALLKKKEVKE